MYLLYTDYAYKNNPTSIAKWFHSGPLHNYKKRNWFYSSSNKRKNKVLNYNACMSADQPLDTPQVDNHDHVLKLILSLCYLLKTVWR